MSNPLIKVKKCSACARKREARERAKQLKQQQAKKQQANNENV
jgi:hypothetical protein